MSNERTTPIRLLLVDDDETLIETMARRFERKGMDVAAARTAGQALDLAAERRFDVALVDLNLPDMSGVELLAKLKEQLGKLFQLDYSLVFYDLTSTYFEGLAAENELAHRGYSRDHRGVC